MGLFDFLDLEGETGAWETAGAVTEGMTKGRAEGTKLKFDEINSLNQARAADQKFTTDDFDLQQKKRTQDYKDLELKQKVNVLPEEATQEDWDSAANTIFGEDRYAKIKAEKDPKKKAAMIGAGELEQIDSTATRLAASRVPGIGTQEYLEYAQRKGVSDAVLERLKAAEAMKTAMAKSGDVNSRYYAGLGLKEEMQGRGIGANAAQKEKDRILKKQLVDEKAYRDKMANAKKTAEGLKAKWDKEKYEFNDRLIKDGKITNKDGMNAFEKTYKAILSTGSPEGIEAFESVYGDETSYLKTKPGAVPAGKPTTATGLYDKRAAERANVEHEELFSTKEKIEKFELKELEKEFQVMGGYISRDKAAKLDKLREKYGGKAVKPPKEDSDGYKVGDIIKGRRWLGGPKWDPKSYGPKIPGWKPGGK